MRFKVNREQQLQPFVQLSLGLLLSSSSSIPSTSQPHTLLLLSLDACCIKGYEMKYAEKETIMNRKVLEWSDYT